MTRIIDVSRLFKSWPNPMRDAMQERITFLEESIKRKNHYIDYLNNCLMRAEDELTKHRERGND